MYISKDDWDRVYEDAKRFTKKLRDRSIDESEAKKILKGEPLCILVKVCWEELKHFLGANQRAAVTRAEWAREALQNPEKVCFDLPTSFILSRFRGTSKRRPV